MSESDWPTSADGLLVGVIVIALILWAVLVMVHLAD